jgi:hypothetical protein
MSDVSREEMNAKLEAVEARTEARFTTLDAKIDKLSGQIEVAFKSLTMDVAAAKNESAGATEAAKEAKDEARGAREAAASTKWNLWAMGLAVIAVILTMWALQMQSQDFAIGLRDAATQSAPPAPPPPSGTGQGTQ